MAVPDHLVLAARDLDAGARWLEARLGVPLLGGGKHVAMGTHNRLLGLGEGFYLELIAVDPAAATPSHPRWFGLDHPERLPADRPRLIHWVARSVALEQEAAACLHDPGAILAMARGDYRWRITVPRAGHLPGEGLLPTLIQWDVPLHPSQALADCGCRLMKLEAFHPAPEGLRPSLRALGLGDRIDLHVGDPVELVGYIKTPRGLVELD